MMIYIFYKPKKKLKCYTSNLKSSKVADSGRFAHSASLKFCKSTLYRLFLAVKTRTRETNEMALKRGYRVKTLFMKFTENNISETISCVYFLKYITL